MSNQRLVARSLVLLSSFAGLAMNVGFLWAAPGAAAWNGFPYLFSGVVALLVKRQIVVGSGVIAMLLVDLWLYGQIALDIRTDYSLAISLLSTLKFFVVFPVGCLLGFVIQKYSPVWVGNR